ncbi:MAG: nuclear transport factor 2 family protein [Acidimicrobiia bacterium]|nr:nuclear transport factor 2 family protein [Acidimicrobiia bacterium]
MSRQNTEAVGRFVDAFNARDVDAIVEMAAPSCVIIAQRSKIEGAFTGPDGARRWAEATYEWAPDSHFVVERVLPTGDDRVVVLGRQTGTAGLGGVPFDVPLAVVAEVDKGLLKKADAHYATHAEALAAAGLAE